MQIDWVLVRFENAARAVEFEFATAELHRQLPPGVRWLADNRDHELVDNVSIANSDVVLLLEHSLLALESRCLERLQFALVQGYDVVEACDSRHSAPMGAGGYATQRGMERYVDDFPLEVISITPDAANTPLALVGLTTVGALRQRAMHAPKVGRVCGAYAHDVSGYFGSDRSDVAAMVPEKTRKLLDVGGGEGNFLQLIKSRRGVETHLVEMDKAAAECAKSNGRADQVWVGDFLAFESPLAFDCISFLDMLEHVMEPERYLIHARQLLSTNGVVLASIPNVGHWSVVADLIEGRWDYVPAGIHCITHLRFFTEKSIADLWERAGYTVERIERVLSPAPSDWCDLWGKSRGLTANRCSLDTYAFLIVGRPKGGV